MFVTDERGKIVSVNRAFVRLCGYADEQLIGADPGILKSGRHSDEFYRLLWDQLMSAGSWSGDIWNRHRNGRVFATRMEISAVRDNGGGVTHYLAILQDITASKRAEERDRRGLSNDPLTGLPNEIVFLDRLNRAFAKHRRDRRPVAVALVDVDAFHLVNDSFGFDAGDELLRQMAVRLKTCLRDSDTVGRFDGGRFAVMLPDLAKREDLALITRKVLTHLSDTYELGYHQRAFVTAGIGLAVLPGDGADSQGLMRAAGLALRQAKASGRNCQAFYDAETNLATIRRLELERDLHEAVRAKQFALHFHPTMDAETGRLVGAEALIRWNHPRRGQLPPGDFLALAEETGLIVEIGDWVLEEVVETLIASHAAGGPPLRISVNISPRQLTDSDIFERLQRRLEAAGLPVNSLELEISETALQSITAKQEGILQKIAGFGIDLSIDNYGIGYTSLKHLRKVPVKTLKIDKIFMRRLGTEDDDTALTEAILAMARSLGIRTVAEGVETAEQWQSVRQRRCDFGQGFLFGRPLSKLEFLDLAGKSLPQAG